ncbi:hypothetical protein [Desulfoluna butyratoxydans]|nr:hypothetical protein [Desulfoluna butyratoxydans]
MTPKQLNPMASAALRFTFYILFLGTMVLLVTWEARRQPGEVLFNENSILESLQAILLFLTAASAYLAGHINESDTPLASLLVGIASIAAIREFDFALDRYVFDGAWQALALLVAILTFALAWHHRKELKEAVLSFLSRPSFGVMASGALTVLVFSRLMGRQVLWKAVMHEEYIRSVKNAVEESCELLGYSLIFFGTLELLHEAFLSRKKARQTRSEQTSQATNPDKASPYLRKNSELHV